MSFKKAFIQPLNQSLNHMRNSLQFSRYFVAIFKIFCRNFCDFSTSEVTRSVKSLGATHNLVVDPARPVPQFVAARVRIHSKLQPIRELFAVFPHKWSFSLSLHPVADIVPNGNPIRSSLLVQAGGGQHQPLASLVPHLSAKVVVALYIWSPGLTFGFGVKGGVENVQVEVGKGRFIRGLVRRVREEQSTSKGVLECNPGGLVDVVQHLVSHLLTQGDPNTDNQQPKHPVEEGGPESTPH